MKTSTASLLCAGFLALLQPAKAATVDFFVFKASGAFTVNKVIVAANPQDDDTFIKKTFTGNDIVNMALGRKLGTHVDTTTEILAVAATYRSDAVDSQLIVFDSTPNLPDNQKVKAVIAKISTLNLEVGYKGNAQKGDGVATIDLQPLANPATDPSAIVSGKLTGAASLVMPFGGPDPSKTKFTFKVSNGAGTVNAKITDKNGGVLNGDGIVTHGAFTASGKFIGQFSENIP